jgi:hypothetical protein
VRSQGRVSTRPLASPALLSARLRREARQHIGNPPRGIGPERAQDLDKLRHIDLALAVLVLGDEGLRASKAAVPARNDPIQAWGHR